MCNLYKTNRNKIELLTLSILMWPQLAAIKAFCKGSKDLFQTFFG